MAEPQTPIALRLAGEDHALEPGRTYLLGSSADCDFRLPAAAPQHARIAVLVDHAEVTDLGGAAGTFHNGERIAHARLAVGDALRIGDVEALVVPDDGAARIVPLPALRLAAATRRLREVGARAALARRRRDAATFDELMADELRRAPWFGASLLLHALLIALALWLAAETEPSGCSIARLAMQFADDRSPGDAVAVPEVNVEPAEEAFTVPPDPVQPPSLDEGVRPVPHDLPATNPRVVAATTPAGAREPIADDVRTVGSGSFQRTVAELRKTGLEIAFVFDSTGSMSGTIADTKATIAQMLAVLRALVPDARIAIVAYRDRGREEYRVRELPLGTDFWRTSNFVQEAAAEGGGDRPEDVRAGLAAAFAQRWQPTARRVVVLAGDAPPHGRDMASLLSEVKTFAANGRSYVHALVASPAMAGTDTHEAFRAIAEAGKGTCTDIAAHDRVLQRVLTLAFGRDFDQDLVAVARAVDAATARLDVAALDLARRGGEPLARALRRDPVPTALAYALVRRPRRDVALELIDMLGDAATPPHTLQAIGWILQRTLDLGSAPVDALSGAVPTGAARERLRRLCRSLPE